MQEINDKITKLKGENLSCIYDDIIIKSSDIILKSKKIELDGAEILIKYGNGQVINLEEDGLKYVLEESMFKILKDEIKIISDGQLGVTIAGEKGGILEEYFRKSFKSVVICRRDAKIVYRRYLSVEHFKKGGTRWGR